MESMKLDIQMFAEGTATYFNGVELTDIYYNNGQLLEMYYNGTLVFKKPTIYKRRIMISDNLKDKTIFINPVTDNVYQFLRDYIDNNPDTFYLSIITVENEALDPSYQKGGYCAILTYDTNGIEVNYEFYNGLLHPVNFLGGDNENNMIVNTNVEIPFNDNLSVVSDINDVNPVYRWLYIEDSNIRPVQVGDKIIEGTKLYFNFPDNPDSWLTGKYGCEVIKCGDKTIMYYATEQPVSRATSAISSIRLESNDMYAFDLNTLEISRNLSSYIIKFYYQDAVSYVDDKFQQYILVDTTTLGV